MTDNSVTTIDLLRHGQPELRNCLLGQTDSPLSETGWRQMRQISTSDSRYQLVISSPLSRCRVFAEEFASERHIPLKVDQDIQEMNFGLWDGKSYQWLHEHHQAELSRFWSSPWDYQLPSGESMPAFYHRITSAWCRLNDSHKGKNILLVCHSGTIRMLLTSILGMNPQQALAMSRFDIPYASLTRIEVFKDDEGKAWPRILFINGSLTAKA